MGLSLGLPQADLFYFFSVRVWSLKIAKFFDFLGCHITAKMLSIFQEIEEGLSRGGVCAYFSPNLYPRDFPEVSMTAINYPCTNNGGAFPQNV